MTKRGKTLHSSTREIIFNVIQFCQREKAAKHTITDLQKATIRVADMTGLSRQTVTKIKREGSTNNGVWCTPGKKRKVKPKKKDSSASNSEDDTSLNLSPSSKASSTITGIEYLESDFEYGSDQEA